MSEITTSVRRHDDGNYEVTKRIVVTKVFPTEGEALRWAMEHTVDEGPRTKAGQVFPNTPEPGPVLRGSGLAEKEDIGHYDTPCSLRSTILLQGKVDEVDYLYRKEGFYSEVLFPSQDWMETRKAAPRLGLTNACLYHRLNRKPAHTLGELLKPAIKRRSTKKEDKQ